jgi:ribulose-phosphate 3-epimerase
VLIMSVNPGFGGQKFIPSALNKITALKKRIQEKKLSLRIAVDGGVTTANIAEIAISGADRFIAGSAIFNSASYQETITAMRKQLASVPR